MENYSEFGQTANPGKNFSDIISHAFNNYMKVILWGILMLILMWIASMVFSFVAGILTGFDQREVQDIMQEAIQRKSFGGGFMEKILAVPGYKANIGISYILGLLLYPLYAGFMYILQKANTGNTINFSDLFIGFRQNTLQIIVYGILSGIIMGISMALCFFPVIFVAPLFLIGLPIVLFENETAINGLTKSFNISSKNYGTFLVVNLISWIIAIAGVLLCGIGLILTIPFVFAAMYAAYCAYCGTPKQIEYKA